MNLKTFVAYLGMFRFKQQTSSKSTWILEVMFFEVLVY